MSRALDDFVNFCIEHGGTLKNHKEFRRLWTILAAEMPRWVPCAETLPNVKKVSYDTFSESEFCFVEVSNGNHEVAQYTLPVDHAGYWSTRSGRVLNVVSWAAIPA